MLAGAANPLFVAGDEQYNNCCLERFVNEVPTLVAGSSMIMYPSRERLREGMRARGTTTGHNAVRAGGRTGERRTSLEPTSISSTAGRVLAGLGWTGLHAARLAASGAAQGIPAFVVLSRAGFAWIPGAREESLLAR